MRIIVIYVGLLLIARWRIPLSRKHVVVDTHWATPHQYAVAQVTTFPPHSDDDTSSAPSRTGHHDQAGSADLISSRHIQTKQNTSLSYLIYTVFGFDPRVPGYSSFPHVPSHNRERKSATVF